MCTARSVSHSHGRRATSRSCSLPEAVQPTTPIEPIDSLDQKIMNGIRLSLERMRDLVEEMLRFNHSAIMKDTQILEKVTKLLESFFPFHRESLKHKQPHIAVQATAVLFLDQWKLAIAALSDVRSGGVKSLQGYVRGKMYGVLALVNRLDENMSKNNAHYESIHTCCESLRNRLNELARDLSNLFLNYKEGDDDVGNHYAGLVREYLKEYNGAFYSVFPRSGLMPTDLAGLKSETVSLCNDVITGIRSLFNFYGDLGKVEDIVFETEGDLRSVLDYLRIPGFTSLAKRRRVREAAVVEDDLVVESEERRITRRINSFIEVIMGELEQEVPDERVDVVSRIDGVEKLLVERLAQKLPAPEQEPKKKRGMGYWDELEAERKKLESQLLEAGMVITKLEGKLATIRNEMLSQEREKALNSMKNKLSDALKPVDAVVEGLVDSQIEKKEVVNVFMVEERCCKCLELEKELEAVKEEIGKIVDAESGESISSVIGSLIQKHKKVVAGYAALEAADKENQTKLEELQNTSNEIVESIKKALEEKGIHLEGTDVDISQQLLAAVNTMMEQHEKELKGRDEPLEEQEKNVSASSLDNDEKRNTEDETEEPNSAGNQDVDNGVASHIDTDAQTSARPQVYANAQTSEKMYVDVSVQTVSCNASANPQTEQSYRQAIGGSNTTGARAQAGSPQTAPNASSVRSPSFGGAVVSPNQGSHSQVAQPIVETTAAEQAPAAVTEKQIEAIVTAKVQEAEEQVKEIKEHLNQNEAVLQKVWDWMVSRAKDVNTEGLSMEDALPLLMKAIEHAEEPLRKEVQKTQVREQQVESHMREFLEEAQKAGLLPDTCELEDMNIIDMLNVVNLYQNRVKEQLQDTARTIEDQKLEIDANRESLLDFGEKLKTVLLRNDIELDTENVDTLWSQVAKLLDDLANGGVEKNFVAISDLNEITESARKLTQVASVNPRQYLPELTKAFEEDHESVASAKKFADPLEAIFKSFDFRMESYNPESASFKFLREKIFQLHLLLGSENNIIRDENLARVFKRFVSLASTLLSFIAASSLRPEDKERVYNQSLRSNL